VRDAVCATNPGIRNANNANVETGEMRDGPSHTMPRAGRVNAPWQDEAPQHTHECRLAESSPAVARTLQQKPSQPSLRAPPPGWIFGFWGQLDIRESNVTACDCLLTRTTAAEEDT
jgi:hypothetical protein